MKLTFAKLFELKNHQVLITKEYEYDGKVDTFKLVQTTDLKDVRPSIGLGFDDEKKRDEAFDNYTEKDANNFLKTIKKMLK